jgi:hypothetical protein
LANFAKVARQDFIIHQRMEGHSPNVTLAIVMDMRLFAILKVASAFVAITRLATTVSDVLVVSTETRWLAHKTIANRAHVRIMDPVYR